MHACMHRSKHAFMLARVTLLVLKLHVYVHLCKHAFVLVRVTILVLKLLAGWSRCQKR